MVSDLFVSVLVGVLVMGVWSWLSGDLVAKERKAHRDDIKAQVQLRKKQNIKLEKLEAEARKDSARLIGCELALSLAKIDIACQRKAREAVDKKVMRLWKLLKQERAAHYEKSQQLVELRLLNEKLSKELIEQVEHQDK